MSDRRLSQRAADRAHPATLRERERRNGRRSLEIGVLHDHLGYFIRRLQVWVFQDFIRTLAPIDIRPAQYSVLVVIAANPGLSQSDLADRLGIERARLVRLLDKLEKRGLTQRLPSRTDRRSHALRLTRDGPEDPQAREDARGPARGETGREARSRAAQIDDRMSSSTSIADGICKSKARRGISLPDPRYDGAYCNRGRRSSSRPRRRPWKTTKDLSWSSGARGYRVITLNRPKQLNAFNEAMHQALKRALTEAEEDGECRALLLTGAGRAFSAGQDLQRADVQGWQGHGARRRARDLLQSARAQAARAALPRGCRRERHRGRRRRQYRARLRHGAGGALGEHSCRPSPGSAWCPIPAAPGSCRAWSAPPAPAGSRSPASRSPAEKAEAWGLIWRMIDDLELMAEAHKLCVHFTRRRRSGSP